jgi:hypothetical protein
MKRKSLRRDKVIFLAVAGAISLILLVMGSYQLYSFTESTAFCGQLCHVVMNPVYTVYKESPHSSVPCVDCHVGPGASYLVSSKISGIPMIFAMLTNSYSRPIKTPVKNLRPARDTCEQCHRPEIFSGDILRNYTTYDVNETNTPHSLNMVLKVGASEQSVAQGIHWHITSKVWYLPLNEQRSEIGWVGVETKSGLAEYVLPGHSGEISAGRVQKEKRLMDCIDCHNQTSHIYSSPEELIDRAMKEGRIDASLPFIKREALKALGQVNPDLATAYTKTEAIAAFYQSTYPKVYEQRKATVDTAVSELKQVALLTTFPEMKVDWQTHPSNAGHTQSEGCFRCHGQLAAGTGGTTNTAGAADLIKSECNLCHYNPGPEGPLTPAVQIPHSIAGLDDCLSCHGDTGIKPYPSDHVGRTNSLCTACHQPSDVKVPPPQTPPAATLIPHSIAGLQDCFSCHGPGGAKPYPADHVGRTNELCTICHKPSHLTTPPAASLPSAAAISHSITGLSDCYSCHGAGSVKPYPADHVGRTNAQCTICHQPPQLAARPPASPPQATPIPHTITGLGDCFVCHGPASIKPYPADHVGRTNALCSICHAVSASTRPPSSPPPALPIPHSIVGLSNCLQCHSQVGAVPFPADHVGRTNTMCTICHKPGSQ